MVVAGGVVSGCGGEDDEAPGPPRPGGAPARKATTSSGQVPSKPEFIRRADTLCSEARQQLAPISKVVNAKIAGEDAAGVAAELKKGLPIADELLRGIRALTPPKGDEATVADFVDTIAEQRGRIPPLVEALEAEDISTIEVIAAELRQGNRRAERIARDYGLASCGPGGLAMR